MALALAILAGPRVATAAADELKKILDLPLSPGSVALLASHTQRPEVMVRLKAAIASANPSVRAVAARVIGLAAAADLLPDVKAALESENEAEAAREEIRTLCAVGGPVYDPAILDGAKRFSPRLDGELVRIVGRVRGLEALSLYFSTLNKLSLSVYDRRAFFRLASRGSREALVAGGSISLGHGDADDWQAILVVAAASGVKLDEQVLLQGLRSRDNVFRGETAWYLAKAYQQKTPPDDGEILEAVSDQRSAQAAEPDAELRFGSEMLRRVLGRPPIEDEAWIVCLETNPECHLDSDFLESPLVDYLTPREREAITRRNKANHPPEAKPKAASKKSTEPRKATANNPPEVVLRLVSGLPGGTGSDLMKVAGCPASWPHRWYTSAQVEFRSDGLPRHVSLGTMPEKPECRLVAEAVFLMSMAPEEDPPSNQSKYISIGILDPDCLACGEIEEGPRDGSGGKASASAVRVRASVKPPKLIQKPEPIYPAESRKRGEQGVGIYESIITRTGCVRNTRVVQSSSYPLLDIAGMEAVTHWKYMPALLDDRPISVYLTVTVTFTLHQ